MNNRATSPVVCVDVLWVLLVALAGALCSSIPPPTLLHPPRRGPTRLLITCRSTLRYVAQVLMKSSGAAPVTSSFPSSPDEHDVAGPHAAAPALKQRHAPPAQAAGRWKVSPSGLPAAQQHPLPAPWQESALRRRTRFQPSPAAQLGRLSPA